MSELVRKLSQGEQKIEVTIRPDRTPKALLECIQKGYVHLKFPSRGGTDLYVPLDRAETKLDGGDFEMGTGSIELIGRLTLDYQEVRSRAVIDLATMTGHGNLEPLTEPIGDTG